VVVEVAVAAVVVVVAAVILNTLFKLTFSIA